MVRFWWLRSFFIVLVLHEFPFKICFSQKFLVTMCHNWGDNLLIFATREWTPMWSFAVAPTWRCHRCAWGLGRARWMESQEGEAPNQEIPRKYITQKIHNCHNLGFTVSLYLCHTRILTEIHWEVATSIWMGMVSWLAAEVMVLWRCGCLGVLVPLLWHWQRWRYAGYGGWAWDSIPTNFNQIGRQKYTSLESWNVLNINFINL